MATEKRIIQKAMNDLRVKRFLQRELENTGISSISIQKTPIATRIAIRVRKPSMVIGKKGKNIKTLSDALEKDYKIDNPQLDVIEVERPELDAKLVAERIARQIEIDGKAKQVVRMNLQDVMEAGAIGCEIIVAGKIVGKGGKAKALRVRKGYLKKAGEVKRLVNVAKHTAYLKAGAIGVVVKIVQPGTEFPDAVKIDYVKLEENMVNANKAMFDEANPAEKDEATLAVEKAREAAEAKKKKKPKKEGRDKPAAPKPKPAPKKEAVKVIDTGGPLVQTAEPTAAETKNEQPSKA